MQERTKQQVNAVVVVVVIFCSFIEVLVDPLREREMNGGMKSFTNLTSQLSAFRF